MTKADLVGAIAEKAGITKTQAAAAIEALKESVQTALQNDEKVALRDFVTFQRKVRAARTGVNPATKKPIQIAEKTVATAKFSPNFTV